MDCSMPGSPVLYHLLEFAQIHTNWFGDANHLILCHPLLLLPSIFPTIRVFSNESALCIRWPKYWSFSCSISTSNAFSYEYHRSKAVSFSASWSFRMNQLFASGGQNIGVSASASVLLMNIKGWLPLEFNVLILLSKGISSVFSNFWFC